MAAPDGRPPLVALDGRERVRVGLLFGIVALVTAVGFAASIAIGRQYAILAGLGLVAYVLGLRHGVDADHIAAIDTTTRKLLRDGKRPLGVGTWFSLGHSTVVVALIVALVFATRWVAERTPLLASAGSVIGTTISGTFLWILGLMNAVIVVEILRVYRGLRQGRFSEAELDEHLDRRGFLARYLGRLFTLIRAPWQIYPVGVLFGLGFDTASEVVFIAISVGVGITGAIPVWMVLVLPLMFACGMVLVDTADGVAMRLAYGWAFAEPVRKVYFNLTITVISVLVALAVGTVELLQVVRGELGLTGGGWSFLAALDFETLGFAIVALFLGAWAVALAYYRLAGVGAVRPGAGGEG